MTHMLVTVTTLLAAAMWVPSFAVLQGRSGSMLQMEGTWVGGFESESGWTPIVAVFERAGAELRGEVVLITEGGRSIRLESPTVDATEVRFGATRRDRKLRFQARRAGGSPALIGTVDPGGAFHLVPCDLEANQPETHAGVYETKEGVIAVQAVGRALRYEDFGTGRFGLLFPSGPGEYFGGPSQYVLHPREIEVSFKPGTDGSMRLDIRESAGAVRSGVRLNLRTEDVEFSNGGIRLSGTLYLPNGAGPHPAIVLLHGSGAANRTSFGAYPELFVTQGFAVLAYDKRGTGDSGGSWTNADFTVLAADAAAAVEFLAVRKDVDATRTGVFGTSQGGGYIASMVPAQSRCAFIVNVSGALTTPAEQELHDDVVALRAAKFGDREIARMRDLQERLNQYFRTGLNRAMLAREIERAQSEPWWRYTDLDRSGPAGLPDPADLRDNWWTRNMDHDPAKDLEKVTVPVLAIFGAKDALGSAAESARRGRLALERAGNRKFEIVVIANANHGLWEVPALHGDDMSRARRYAPGYLEKLREWLSQFARR